MSRIGALEWRVFRGGLKELRLQIYERTTSPLFGSFIISWCLWNYKFIVILFSDASVITTFSLIEKVSFPSIWHIIGCGLVAPALTALAYIYLYPIPAKKVYEYSLQRQKEITEMRRRVEDETPLTLVQSRQIRLNISTQMDEHYKEIERKDSEIARLKAAISDLSAAPNEKIEEIEPAKPQKVDVNELEISPSQKNVMKLISDNGGFISNRSFAHMNPDDLLQFEYDLGELAAIGLVRGASQAGISGQKLTHDGKGYLLKIRSSA